ncbi:Arc family DNA-binding protein [Rhizobium leguminosarum]|uniref:Arc family DNA-binding protein n=1 Tax=Rhizobium leguminosarum TaxID=384 RepID=UPI00103CE139|nr:Arc family DNA-binding protein [Rhizobium leguminosarum]TBZ75888.1 Arc family DNA-binding protein [Rhizobium leguminosarum bv. viciae]
MAQRPGRGSDQFPLRLPEGMRERVKAAADASGRSMNAEVIDRLERSFEARSTDLSGLEESIKKAVAELVDSVEGRNPNNIKSLKFLKKFMAVNMLKSLLDLDDEDSDDAAKMKLLFETLYSEPKS